MNRLKIKIIQGKLWKPGTNILLKEGDELTVENNLFWRRRLKDGSIKIIPNNQTIAKKPTSIKSKSKEQ